MQKFIALILVAGSWPAIGWARAADPISVYKIHPVWDPVVITTSSLSLALTYFLSPTIVNLRCPPCNPSEVNSFDRPAIGNHSALGDTLSDVTVGLAMAGPAAWSIYHLGWNQVLVEDLMVFGEVLAVNGALVSLVKHSVQRPIPRVYEGDPDLSKSTNGYRAFYSGHTSVAFSALMATAYTLHLRRGPEVWPWVVASGLGVSVAVERVLGGRHFPSDVIVGAIAGTGIGLLVPLLHRRGPGEEKSPSANWWIGPSSGGIQAQIRWGI